MPADTIKYQVLDVGQGSGNFIEMYTSGALITTALIDLGSERATDEGGGLSVEYIVKTLNTMASPTIDYIFLSHSDTDHISLLDQLLDSFVPPGTVDPLKKPLLIKKVSYGGDSANYAKGKKKYNVLNRLKTYMPTLGTPIPFSASYGSYRKVFGLAPIPYATIEGVDFYILTANAPAVAPTKRTRKGTAALSGYGKNTVSVIVVVSFERGQYIATGDATGATLVAANKELTAEVLTTYFPLVAMVTAPHHGSESTTFSFRASNGKRDNDEAVKNFKLFVDNLKSKTITASAGMVGKFRHPSVYLMSYFWPWLHGTPLYTDPTLAASNAHYYTAYFKSIDGYSINDGTTTSPWPIFDWWYTVQTASNIYTNTYYDLGLLPSTSTQTWVLPPNPGSLNAVPTAAPYPPSGVAWTYNAVKTTTGSSITVQRMDTDPNLLALRREIIARSERMAAIRDGLEEAEADAAAANARAPAPAVAPHAVRDLAPPRPSEETAASTRRRRRLKVLT
jgi:hypothetical protein